MFAMGYKVILYAFPLSVVITLITLPSHADIVVIGHPSAIELNQQQVTNIFLGKIRKLPNNAPIAPLDLPEDDEVYTTFYAKVMNKSLSQVRSYWARAVFMGSATPPTTIDDGDEVKSIVAGNPESIGYIDTAEVNLDDTVKVLYSITY